MTATFDRLESPPWTPTPAALSCPYYSTSTLTVAAGSPPQHSSLSGFCSESQLEESVDGAHSSQHCSLSYSPFIFHSPESSSVISPSLCYSASEVSMTRRGSSSSCSEMDMSMGYGPAAFTPPSDAGSPESSYCTNGYFPAPSPSTAPSYICGDCEWVSPHEEHMRLHYRAHTTREPFECLVRGSTDAVAHPADFLENSHANTHSPLRKRGWSGADGELPMPTGVLRLPPTPEQTPLVLTDSACYPSSKFSPVARELLYGSAPPMPHHTHSFPTYPSPATPSTELVHLHHTPASAYPLSPVTPPQLQYTQLRDKYHIQPSAREVRGHACLERHCGRVFKRLEHLRRHERTHTSEKPFGCDWDGCGRRSDNLNQHKKTHVKLGGRNGPGGRSNKGAAADRH